MTMPAPTSTNDSPKVVFIITGALSPDAAKNEPLAWAVGQPHPVLQSLSIVGMFAVPGEGIEVYSASPSRKGVRSFIPMHWVRYVHEDMGFDVFSDEFAAAMAGEPSPYLPVDEDVEDVEDEDEPEESQAPPPNGQPAP